jgi:hypothetical protein
MMRIGSVFRSRTAFCIPVGIGTIAGAACSATLLDNSLHAAFGSMIICSVGVSVLLFGGCLGR